jgi:REP element-mobilizing transposase RayT
MRELPKRKPNRLKNFDYSLDGAYFVTICAKNREEIFGTLVCVGATALGRPFAQNIPTEPEHPYVELTALGRCVDETIRAANNEHVRINEYVIMPDHIHILIVIQPGTRESQTTGDRGRSPLHLVVRNIKSYVTKWAGFSPWQKSFHDRIIRNEEDYRRLAEYIANNPARTAGKRTGAFA